MSEFYTEYDAEPVADDFEPAIVDDAEYAPEPVDADEVQAVQEAGFGQIDAAMADFKAAVGAPAMSREEWKQVKAHVEQLPEYAEYVSEQQALARGEHEVQTFLEQLPDNIRGRALELAQQYVEAASAKFGGGRELAQAALLAGAGSAMHQQQGIDAFVEATVAAANRIGVDPASVDIGSLYRAVSGSLNQTASDLPGHQADEVVVRAIVNTLREGHGRNQERPLADDYGIVAQIVRDLRGPTPKPVSRHDYTQGGRAADIATGRITPSTERHA